jgi:glutamate-5-semialdehyde dehydrogenase
MTSDSSPDKTIQDLMKVMGQQARHSARTLVKASSKTKQQALNSAAEFVRQSTQIILAANEVDMASGKRNKLSPAMLDRLKLDEARVMTIASSLDSIAELDDPIGQVIAAWDRPNGLKIERVRTPLGVIGVIYESRPNVTADAGALCLKAGNAVVLRAGSDSANSSRAIHQCLIQGLESAGLPTAAIQLVATTDRAAVGEMLAGLNGNLDVLVPRGGKSLVARVQTESRVPVFAHLEGICHVYVDGEADIEMAKQIVVNSKMRRTGICGAMETLLIDTHWADTNVRPIVRALQSAGCEIRGDETICSWVEESTRATETDWSTEYLAPIVSVKLVDGVEEAIEHINLFGSGHTESIVTENNEAAARFMNEIDSAILLHNASTQFADGGEFGMGAEIGIATGKMHARGPVGVEQLTSFNYRVRGSGQVRS